MRKAVNAVHAAHHTVPGMHPARVRPAAIPLRRARRVNAPPALRDYEVVVLA